MRRRGVSNDLRDRGDEWPLLKVVSGLSVVVATVVDEVSMVWQRGFWHRFLELFFMGLYRSAAASLQPALARWAARRCERVRALCNRLIAHRYGRPAPLAKLCWLK